jgi:hypothetical protein
LKNQPPGPKWLSKDWTKLVAFTKRYADKIGLGCDFTFGSLWPFGGSIVKRQDASRDFKGLSPQRLENSWESAPGQETGASRIRGTRHRDSYINKKFYVLNHLDRHAFARYAKKMGKALAPALKGKPAGSPANREQTSALFCDSLEIITGQLWTKGFGDRFYQRFGYRLEPYMPRIDRFPDIRYDYRQLLSDYMFNEFYQPFVEACRKLGALSRVQCHGAPTDLLRAYAAADIPESEAILFDPNFSVIAASAAALAGRQTVTAETFTCIYGWKPRPNQPPYIKQEQTADLKLLADAMFANGVNHIFWHGMPYNPKGGRNEFYATVHVGPDGALAREIPAFNRYMARVSGYMQKGKPVPSTGTNRGKTYSDVAAYIPYEDTLMLNRLPKKMLKPSGFFHWEMHYVKPPTELKGYHPLWVSAPFLKDAYYAGGLLHILWPLVPLKRDCSNSPRIDKATFSSLYIDSKYIDRAALIDIFRLARQGLPVCLKQKPREPGRVKTVTYKQVLKALTALPNVSSNFKKIAVNPPLVQGSDLPDFWCRVFGQDYYIFFANPKAQNLTYPMKYGQSFNTKTFQIPVCIWHNNKHKDITLKFKPYQSVLLKVSPGPRVKQIDITFTPKP